MIFNVISLSLRAPKARSNLIMRLFPAIGRQALALVRNDSMLLSFCLLLTFSSAYAEEDFLGSDQQINDFSLAGYGEKGRKTWDLSGKSADIFTDTVKLKNVTGNLYGEEEDTKLTAKEGEFSKVDGSIHLEEDVVITTSSGTKMVTDALDWSRKEQLVDTDAHVNIERQNLVADAVGARAEPSLKKVTLKKNVRLDINPIEEGLSEEEKARERVIITCVNALNVDYEKNTAVFNDDVRVDREDASIFSDKMDVFFSSAKAGEGGFEVKTAQVPGLMGSNIDKIIARGNVRVVQGENTSYSTEATYSAKDGKVILTGRPKLVIASMEDFKDASLGD